MDIGETSTVVAVSHQVSSNLGEETVILELDGGIYYGLNEVGARIWNLLREPRTVAEIRDAIADEYDVESERCLRDVLELLGELESRGLIEVRDEPTP